MNAKKSSEQGLKIGVLLGKNIAQARRAREWTQQELAERIGIESVTLSRIETGASVPSITRLAEIADVLDVSVSSLVSGVSQRATDQAHELAESMRKLSPTDRRMLTEMFKQLSARMAK